mgnify:CR=1 FL=1
MTPALASVGNAVVDALADLGVEHVELPATPERACGMPFGPPAGRLDPS